MKVLQADFMRGFIHMANDGWLMDWHERNGGNLSYRLKPEEVRSVSDDFSPGEWRGIGVEVPGLRGEYFLVTGSGKYFSNVQSAPEDTLCIAEIDESGSNYRIVWGLINGGKPTSEFMTHLMNHEIKKQVTGGRYRVIYHCHPANIIALTFVLPLTDRAFTRELWETIAECSVVFPGGVGVLPFMVPGGSEIARASGELMKRFDLVVWAHHGLFAAGEDFDSTFGLMHTAEKAAGAAVKARSMLGAAGKRQSITTAELIAMSEAFGTDLAGEFL